MRHMPFIWFNYLPFMFLIFLTYQIPEGIVNKTCNCINKNVYSLNVPNIQYIPLKKALILIFKTLLLVCSNDNKNHFKFFQK